MIAYNVWGISLHRESDRGHLSHGDSFNKQAGGEGREGVMSSEEVS